MLKISVVLVGVAAAVTAGATLLKSEKLGLDLCCILEKPAAQSASTGSEVPLACSLKSKDLVERKAEASALLSNAARSAKELENGYAIDFEAGHGREIVDFVESEGKCCPFFHFAIDFKPNGGPVTLSITGPEGSKAFLSDLVKPLLK